MFGRCKLSRTPTLCSRGCGDGRCPILSDISWVLSDIFVRQFRGFVLQLSDISRFLSDTFVRQFGGFVRQFPFSELDRSIEIWWNPSWIKYSIGMFI